MGSHESLISGEVSSTGEFKKFFTALEARIKQDASSGVGKMLTSFRDLCTADKLTRSIGAAINSPEAQPLAVLMVDHFITDGREKIITDTAAALQSLFDTTLITVGGTEYSLNQFMIATVNGGEGHQDSSISVDFVLPGAIKDQLKKLPAPATPGPQPGGESQINGASVSQVQPAEAVVSSPEATIDRDANRNAVFAEMLPRLLNGVDAEFAQLITAAVQRTPGKANIIVELPMHMDRKAVRKELQARFGGVAFAQNYSEGANAIQITVNNLSQ